MAAVAPTNTETTRKKPGRPPSRKTAPPLANAGIVQTPENPENQLEFKHSNPNAFKTLFSYLKNIKALEIHLKCDSNSLTFFARDRCKTSRIVTKIDCNNVYRYYCEKECWIYLNRDKLEKIFSSIDKTFCLITLQQSKTNLGTLSITFNDFGLDKECAYRVVLSNFEIDEDLYEAEREVNAKKFPVQFTLTSKQFKKSIGDASNHSDCFSYEKFGNYPLQLTCSKPNFTYVESYLNDKKINCVSTVQENTMFRCKMKVQNIKPLSTSLVTDEVRIFCCEEGDVLFRSSFDEKKFMTLNILTKPS